MKALLNRYHLAAMLSVGALVLPGSPAARAAERDMPTPLGALCPVLLGTTEDLTSQNRPSLIEAVVQARSRVTSIQEQLNLELNPEFDDLMMHHGTLFFPKMRLVPHHAFIAHRTQQFAISRARLDAIEVDLQAIREGWSARGRLKQGHEPTQEALDQIAEATDRNHGEFERRYGDIFPYMPGRRMVGFGVAFASSLALGTYFSQLSYDVVVGSTFGINEAFQIVFGATASVGAFINSANGFRYVRGLIDPTRRMAFEKRQGPGRTPGFPSTFAKLGEIAQKPGQFEEGGIVHLWEDLVVNRAELEALRDAARDGRLADDEFLREFQRSGLRLDLRGIDNNENEVDVAFRLKLDHLLFKRDGKFQLLLLDRVERVTEPAKRTPPRGIGRLQNRWSGAFAPQGI